MSATTPSPVFLGTFSHKLDDRKRVPFPSKWFTKGIEKEQHSFFIFTHPKGWLVGYILPKMQRLFEESDRVAVSDVAAAEAMRKLFGRGEIVEVDTAGRILLTPRMLKYVKIEQEVDFIGAGAYFEIHPHRDEEAEEDADAILQTLARLGL